jgi:hypothetical protein
MVRRSTADVASEAETALSRALQSVLGDGFDVVHSPDSGPDLTIAPPHGPPVAIEVKAVARRAEPGPVANALRTWDERLRGLRRSTGGEVYGVVVAAAIPEATKAILRENGWGWLDRRGELDVRIPGLVIHATDVEPSVDTGDAVLDRQAKDPIRGRAGITAAAYLLLEPDATPGVREIARAGGLAPSSVSGALADLRHASLVRADGGALIPELFWALADAWKPQRDALAEVPRLGRGARLALGLDDLAAPGWVAGGTLAAAAWSAPVVVASGAPPDFYVPNENEARAAGRELHAVVNPDERACTVAVAPTILVVRPRNTPTAMATSWLEWPIVHPLFAALDLAQDRARGVEILEDWTPPAPFARVW